MSRKLKLNVPSAGNPVLDTISGAVAHYAKYKRKIDTVTLSPTRWRSFLEAVRRLAPEACAEANTEEFHFADIKVKKGSRFMASDYDFKLKPKDLAKAEA